MSKAIEMRGRPLGFAEAGGRALSRRDPEKCDGRLRPLLPLPAPHARRLSPGRGAGPGAAGRLGGPRCTPLLGRVWPSPWAWGSTLWHSALAALGFRAGREGTVRVPAGPRGALAGPPGPAHRSQPCPPRPRGRRTRGAPGASDVASRALPLPA